MRFMGIDLPLKGARTQRGDPISAHYEISRANLTKSLLVFLLHGEYIVHFAGDYRQVSRKRGGNVGES
ncbi:transposase [Pseudomonas sp. IT-P44]